MDCCIPKRVWATNPLPAGTVVDDSTKVTYHGRVMHQIDGHGFQEITRCQHEHASRDEAQACADALPLPAGALQYRATLRRTP
jgi:hypothetical protein